MVVPEEERWLEEKNDETHKPTNSGSSTNCKKDKAKETNTKIHYSNFPLPGAEGRKLLITVDAQGIPETMNCINPIYTVISIHTYILMIKFMASLAYLNCQHHYSYTLGPFLSKIRVPWIQALWYHDNGSDNPDGYLVTKGGECPHTAETWTKGWFESQAGQSGTVQDFVMLLRTAGNLKLMNCFF